MRALGDARAIGDAARLLERTDGRDMSDKVQY